jgi:hypothetical protein
MFITISFLSVLMTGCGETEETVAPPPTVNKEEIKEEIKEEVKAEAKAEEEAEKKEEEDKAALKEEIKEEIKEEAKAEEATKPVKKAAATEQEFTARVSVDKMPIKDRKERFDKAAKSQLMKTAAKKGFKRMSGSISWVGAKCKPAGDKCVWSAKATFKK